MAETKVVLNGVSTVISPLFITNATTSYHTVRYRKSKGAPLTESPTIAPGQQIKLFTGTANEVAFITDQLDRQRYPNLATAITNGADVYYTVGEPSSVDNISEVVEKEEGNNVKELAEIATTRKKALKATDNTLLDVETKEEKA